MTDSLKCARVNYMANNATINEEAWEISNEQLRQMAEMFSLYDEKKEKPKRKQPNEVYRVI